MTHLHSLAEVLLVPHPAPPFGRRSLKVAVKHETADHLEVVVVLERQRSARQQQMEMRNSVRGTHNIIGATSDEDLENLVRLLRRAAPVLAEIVAVLLPVCE